MLQSCYEKKNLTAKLHWSLSQKARKDEYKILGESPRPDANIEPNEFLGEFQNVNPSRILLCLNYVLNYLVVVLVATYESSLVVHVRFSKKKKKYGSN